MMTTTTSGQQENIRFLVFRAAIFAFHFFSVTLCQNTTAMFVSFACKSNQSEQTVFSFFHLPSLTHSLTHSLAPHET